MANWNCFQNRLVQLEQEFQQLDHEIKQMMNYQTQYNQLKQKLEFKQHELKLIEQRLQQTEHHRQQEEVNDLVKQMGMEVCNVHFEITCFFKIIYLLFFYFRNFD